MGRFAYILGSNGPKAPGRLEYAVRDAELLSGVLARSRYKFEVVHPADSTDPYQIKKELDKLAKSCSENDVFLFYFSGHGELIKGELMLVLDNTVPGDENTYLPVSWVRESRSRSEAGRRLIILDCCHAEAGIGAKVSGQLDLVGVIDVVKTEAMLLASRKLERAREFPHLQGSFLTTELCSFLAEAQTETVGLTDVLRHLNAAARRHNKQKSKTRPVVPVPFLHGTQEGEFLFTAATCPDLSRFVRIMDGGAEDLDVTMAVLTAVTASFAAKGLEVSLSVRHVSEKSRAAGQVESQGEFFAPVQFIVEHFGVLPASVLPYKSFLKASVGGQDLAQLEAKGPLFKAKFYRLQNLRDVRAQLELKRPVLAAIHPHEDNGWDMGSGKGRFRRRMRPIEQIVKTVKRAESGKGRFSRRIRALNARGFHAIVLVWQNDEGFGFANTWGFEFGEDGFGRLSNKEAAMAIDQDQLWAIEAVPDQRSPDT